jgi:N-sulfoglucosamine sulfohydrolase
VKHFKEIVLGATVLFGFGKSVAAAKPNIIFCVLDDGSFHTSANGTTWVKTLGFDFIARNGVLFNNCYTTNAKSTPSRSCILTGRHPWALEDAANLFSYFPSKFKVFPEVLAENGFYTGFTGKGWSPGNSGGRNLTGKAYQTKKNTTPATGIQDCNYSENFKQFFADWKTSGKSNFCFWMGSQEPHRVYEFKSGVNKGGKHLSDIDIVPEFWPDNDSVRYDMLDYAMEIEWYDSHVVKVLNYLKDQGQLDNTIIVFTSDNGMPFPRSKGQCYEISNHMPLAIMWKNGIIATDRIVDDFVSFTDFAPTFLEVAGISEAASGMQHIQGKSLTDIFNSDKSGQVNPQRDHVLLCKERNDLGRPRDTGYPIRAIRKGDYLYIYNFETSRWPTCNPETGYMDCDSSPTKTVCIRQRLQPNGYKYWNWSFGMRKSDELYNIKSDRWCVNNLAENPDYQTIKESLHKSLFDELTSESDPRMLGNGYLFDQYPYSNVSMQNYYQRYMNGDFIPSNTSDLDPAANPFLTGLILLKNDIRKKMTFTTNPILKNVSINFSTDVSDVQLIIFDVSGKVLSILNGTTTVGFNLSTSNLKSGSYIIRAIFDNQTSISEKLIIR